MRSTPDQTLVDWNYLMILTFTFIDFSEEHLRVCATGFPLVKSQVLVSHLSSSSRLCCGSYQLAIRSLLVWSSLYVHRKLSANQCHSGDLPFL